MEKNNWGRGANEDILEKRVVITRASFCCTKKLKKLHLFLNESCKKLHLFTNIKNDRDLLKRFIYLECQIFANITRGEMVIVCQQFRKHANTSLHSARSCKPTVTS